MPEVKPFDRLTQQQQTCCVDIAIGMAVIAARCAAFGKENFKGIAEAWAKSAGLDVNLCKYALRDVTNALYDTSWEFHVTHQGMAITTQFTRRPEPGGGNGEESLIIQ